MDNNENFSAGKVASEESVLELRMAKHQLKVYEDMHEVRRDMHNVVGRVGDLEKGHRDINIKLDDHEKQRVAMHAGSDKKLDFILSQMETIGAESSGNAAWISKANKVRLRITFTISGIVGTLGSLWWIYNYLEKHGVVFVLDQTTR